MTRSGKEDDEEAKNALEELLGIPFDALNDDDALLDKAIFQETVADGGQRQVEAHDIRLATPNLGEDAALKFRAFTYGVQDSEPVRFVNPNGGKIDLPGATAPDEANYSKRQIGTEGLDILTHGSAETEIWQTRNEVIEGRGLRSFFIYELPHVSSGEPIVPAIDRTKAVHAGDLEFEAGTIALGIPEDNDAPYPEHTLAHALDTFLMQLLKPLPDQLSTPTWTDLVFEYESGLFTVEEGGPVILVHSNLKAGDQGVERAAIAGMAGELKEWLDARPALMKNGVPRGRMIVDARVYVQGSSPDEERLIMRLRRCVFRFGQVDG